MGIFWDHHENAAQAYDQVYQPQEDGTVNYDNQASTSHELMGGAAAMAAMAMYEHSEKEKGEPVSHGFAKECIAGLAGFEVDKLAETKGENFFDKERAKHEAKKRAEEMYDAHYGQGENFQYDENNRWDGFQNRPPPPMDRRQEEFLQQQQQRYQQY